MPQGVRATISAVALASVLPLAFAEPDPLGARLGAPPAAPNLQPFAELAAGPVLGLDEPIKGCSCSYALGLRAGVLEAGLRARAAYDFGLDAFGLSLDLSLGLGEDPGKGADGTHKEAPEGGDLRIIVGVLLPLGGASLPDPGGQAERLELVPAPWPNRFGLGASIAVLPWSLPKARLGIDAELCYTAYRVAPPTSSARLSGAAAFAAGVEATLALRLRWGG